MIRALVLAPEAEVEIADARQWYEERRPGSGAEFVAAVGMALAAITDNPLQYQTVWKHFRRAGVRGFPYSLFYSASQDVVRVVACVHGKRDPAVWRDRS